MAKNPRARSGRDLRRNAPKRRPYPRMLIVCEGSKTEVNYFEEIRQEKRLPNVNLRIIPSPLGTEPQQIVEGAEAEFLKSKGFEKVYVVFDRDQHLTYANAIAMAEARNEKLRNDEKKSVAFEAIVSVPCFELWLLLHFADITGPLNRYDALARLRHHLVGYQKGNSGIYSETSARLTVATQRAAAIRKNFCRLPGNDAFTNVDELVEELRKLKGA